MRFFCFFGVLSIRFTTLGSIRFIFAVGGLVDRIRGSSVLGTTTCLRGTAPSQHHFHFCCNQLDVKHSYSALPREIKTKTPTDRACVTKAHLHRSTLHLPSEDAEKYPLHARPNVARQRQHTLPKMPPPRPLFLRMHDHCPRPTVHIPTFAQPDAEEPEAEAEARE